MTAMVLLLAWQQSQVEFWLPVRNHKDYDVSNLGRVRSRKGRQTIVLIQHSDRGGYPKVVLYASDSKSYKNCSVHRLVALAFIPNLKCLPEVNHIDGNKTNNYWANLEWVSTSDNQKHAFRLGLQKPRRGESNPRTKVSNAQVVEIRAKYQQPSKSNLSGHVRLIDLAEEYGLSFQHISRIVRGTDRAFLD